MLLFEKLLVSLVWCYLYLLILDLHNWGMCVYASNQSSSKDFLFKINFAYATNYIFGDLFSIQVMSLFHDKHLFSNAVKYFIDYTQLFIDYTFLMPLLSIFKYDRTSGRLSIWVGSEKDRSFFSGNFVFYIRRFPKDNYL